MTTYSIIYKKEGYTCDRLLETVNDLGTAIDIARRFFSDYPTVAKVWVVDSQSVDEMFSGAEEETYFEMQYYE